MEALILVLIAALWMAIEGLFALLLSALIGLLAPAVFLLMDLFAWWWTGRWVGRWPSATPPPQKRRRWTRWLLIGSAGFAVLLAGALLIINQWFVDDFARWALRRQQERSGIVITAETIEGSLFTGRFHAGKIVVKRENDPVGLIDLTVRRVEVTIPILKLFSKVVTVSAVSVEGVQGRFERGVPGQPFVEKEREEFSLKFARAFQPRRHFEIADLSVSDLNVVYADHTRKRPLTLPVTLEKLSAHPLHSRWAVFDILFRTNAAGTIAGRPFHIATTGEDLGRTTEWTVDGLPVSVLASQIGGPFSLLTEGTCDVRVKDRWRESNDERVISMDWSLILNHVTAEVPETTSPMMALLAKPVVAYINAKGDRVPLSFTLEIDENNFDGAASVEAAGLWEIVSDSLAATLGKELGIETDTVKKAEKKAVDLSKGLLEKWRKKKQTE